jgi:hypothetical protein
VEIIQAAEYTLVSRSTQSHLVPGNRTHTPAYRAIRRAAGRVRIASSRRAAHREMAADLPPARAGRPAPARQFCAIV